MRVVLYGDADMNGVFNENDPDTLQWYLSGSQTVPFNEENILASDVDGNGELESIDITLMARKLAQLIDYFPVEV